MSAVRTWPPVRRLLAARPVVRLASVRGLARIVEPSLGFALRELSGARGAARYRVRGVGATVVVRHNTSDVWTLNEVFYLHSYQPPETVAERLRSLDRPVRVLDLGANVGMYGALMQAEHPGATVRAYEPDPRNLTVHRRCMELNGSPSGWSVVEACATAADGVRTFDARGDDMSSVTENGRGISVAAKDVLPELAEFDIAKIDIEGSEWESSPTRASAPPEP